MMSTYVRIQNGRVAEIIASAFNEDGTEVPIAERFTPEIVAELVDVTQVEPTPQAGDVAVNTDGAWVFSSYAAPPPSAEQIIATNTAMRNYLLSAATLAIAPLQDASDLGEATSAETALLTAWKQFRIAVNRVDLKKANPEWPPAPQAGYGSSASPSAAKA